MATRHLKLGR